MNVNAPKMGVVELNPGKFYALTDMIQNVHRTGRSTDINTFNARLQLLSGEIDKEVDFLSKANSAMLAEIRQTTRRRANPLLPSEEQEDILANLRHTSGGQNFLHVIFEVMRGVQHGFRQMKNVLRGCYPGELTLSGRKISNVSTMEDFQFLNLEISLNQGTVNRFIDGLISVDHARDHVVDLGKALAQRFDAYYQVLLNRHSVEGIQIHGDPVSTDIAMSIFENVDSHGEISEDGKNPGELSAYSLRKAQIMADSIRQGIIGDFVQNPAQLLEYLTAHLRALWELTEVLSSMYKKQIDDLKAIIGADNLPQGSTMEKEDFFEAIDMLQDLDPRSISFKEKTGLLTPEERYELRFRNETLEEIVRLLQTGANSKTLIDYILGRKAEWRVYLLDENSFYVCKVSAGNPFLGEPPGALSITPGTRPNIKMSEILGTGFDEVREHFETVEASAEWYSLFAATSPSKSGDKTHVLLIGPQGCGKSEVFRAVGGDKKSIGVFAQGSDFLTCWKGETEKNPKRLFEGALKLQKDSGKHVHIMIDEIDTIFNKDSARDSFGGTNLVTEFQILMDGVVHYPHLSVWGATNVPERIPMPMIRRFSKVLIVGELSQADRVKLLKHFAGHMPADDIDDGLWEALARKLDGATGDVIRKVVDHVWRTKMTSFVTKHPSEAKQVLATLNQGSKFSMAEFTEKRRHTLHAKLREYPVAILKGEDLDRSIETHLGNIAIHNEIKTAVETYSKARAFLAAINAKRVQIET